MLPTGHIEWTWAGLNLIQRRTGLFEDADYRIVALAVMMPDLIDKPLAWFVFPDANAALFFGHTLLLHGLVWGFAAATGRWRRWLPYLLASPPISSKTGCGALRRRCYGLCAAGAGIPGSMWARPPR